MILQLTENILLFTENIFYLVLLLTENIFLTSGKFGKLSMYAWGPPGAHLVKDKPELKTEAHLGHIRNGRKIQLIQ